MTKAVSILRDTVDRLTEEILDIDSQLAGRRSEMDAIADDEGNVPPHEWREYAVWRGRAVAAQSIKRRDLKRAKTMLRQLTNPAQESLYRARDFLRSIECECTGEIGERCERCDAIVDVNTGIKDLPA